MMSKRIRAVTDIMMYGALCFLAGTGLLLHVRLVPGFMGGRGLTVLGLSRHEWGAYHLWIAYFMVFLVFVHLAINYSFIKTVIAVRRTWVVIGLGLAGFAIIFSFLFLPLKRTGTDDHEQGMKMRAGKQ